MQQKTIENACAGLQEFDYEKRRYNDTVTWLAEVLPGQMCTPFDYHFDGHELYADDGSAMGKVFDDAIQQAENLPGYERRRRRIEKAEYHDMLAMMRGDLPNSMVVQSDFPPELMESRVDVGGYNAIRKPTFLRVIIKTSENTLRMYSQTLDGSNRQALEQIRERLGYKTEAGELLGQRMHVELEQHQQYLLVDELTHVYDRSLQQQFGGQWRAGRQDRQHINTYDFVRQQHDLLTAYLVSTRNFDGGENDYNLAAAIGARYRKYQQDTLTRTKGYEYSEIVMRPAIAAHVIALEEMKFAGTVARQTGETYSGCGLTIKLSRSENGDDLRENLEELGYGNKTDKLPDDKYGSRYFKCPKGHKNTRWKKDKLIERCQVCNCSVRCD